MTHKFKDYLPNPFTVDYQHSNEPLDLYTEKEMLKYADWVIREVITAAYDEIQYATSHSIANEIRETLNKQFGVE